MAAAVGSSPRLRGTVLYARVNPPSYRFIPAPAGNSSGGSKVIANGSVHPRACGEQSFGAVSIGFHSGSSPRLRGTAPLGAFEDALQRFIPAPAGNSLRNAGRLPLTSVHPRACGEQTPLRKLVPFLNGSSPRLRGTAFQPLPPDCRSRFIPAPAGNRFLASHFLLLASVHPRACGEQFPDRILFDTTFGSSPRLRGTVHVARVLYWEVRFIPAPAGNSWPWYLTCGSPPVHPRACGEQSELNTSRLSRIGSSPRLRGTAKAWAANLSDSRFIPAPAGNSLNQGSENQDTAVHPRACGEQ